MEQEPPATFVIAGAGIVGLTLALSLHKHTGIRPEVYEKRTAETFHQCVGAGMGMFPNGLRVLRDISPELLEKVRQVGKPFLHRRWVKHCGTAVVAEGNEDVLHHGDDETVSSLGIGRWRLHQALWEATQEAGISIHFKKAIEDIVQLTTKCNGNCNDDNQNDNDEHQEGDLVCVYFADHTHRMTHLLFGTDGTWSKTRQLVLRDNEVDESHHALEYSGVTCLMGIAQDCPKPDTGVCCPTSTTTQCHAIFFPTLEHEQCFQFYFPLAHGDADSDTWGTLSEQVGKEECRLLCETLRGDGWDEKYCQPLEHVTRAVQIGFCEIQPPLQRWAYGRVVLLGDAAHPPIPYTGQGAQMGLEDAGTMAALLKEYCCLQGVNDGTGTLNWDGLSEALRQFESLRIPRVAEIQKYSHQMGEMQQKQTECRKYARKQAMKLQREVFFYQTSPLMIPGAQYDFQTEVQKAIASA
mmetsp:Transcript_13275/g.25144  ORF Transcript_13275/g.25144 Transcript_13275/m.25144 type:complete len:466 (+) Transcript_13275:140-1537(+)|eukprot:scaffold15108_cov180-Amphora_coffeaeformis.AAC.27